VLDHYAKEQYNIASSLLEDINGEDIRELLLKVTIENARVNIFKAMDSHGVVDDEEVSMLEKLAKSLLVRIVFDNEIEPSLVESAALVCAQVYETLTPTLSGNIITLDDPAFINRVITSLLYYVSGYDPSAKKPAKELQGLDLANDLTESMVMNGLVNLALFDLNNIQSVDLGVARYRPKNLLQLKEYTQKVLLKELDSCIRLFKEELSSFHKSWNKLISLRISRLHEHAAATNEQTICLIALVLNLVDRVFSSRAISVLQPPNDCPEDVWSLHMTSYLNEGVYLIWTPHKEAIEKGMLTEQNNILAIPTGTGKSLIAEHKIITSLQRGRVIIYLSPTLALCRQISNRMKKILSVQSLTLGKALIVDDLDAFDEIEEEDSKLILVMTPEKCSTLLLNRTELFQSVSLCVVDEFHNIKSGKRGALLDALLARFSDAAPNATFLLLSALIDNSDILPRWLHNLNNKEVGTIFTRWRPSRTIRGFIAHPKKQYDKAIERARNSGKKTYSEEVEADLFFCVQDIWSEGERQSAVPIRLPKKFKIRFGYKYKRWTTSGYGNDIARQLGNWLASCHMPVLIFSQTTRHLLNEIDHHSRLSTFEQSLNEKVSAYLELARAELGFDSELIEGLKKGIGVHTQALIEEEQEAVEEFFKSCTEGVVCATGTLAQGLNLPASAVVVNTTKQHSEDDSPKPMTKEEVINMLGRAGRPGLGFQSIGLIVPQYPSMYDQEQNSYSLAKEYTEFLERIDAVVPLNSGLVNVIEMAASSSTDVDPDNFSFLINVAATDGKVNKVILNKSVASYFVPHNQLVEAVQNCNKWLDGATNDFTLKRVVNLVQKSAISISLAKTLIDSFDEDKALMLLVLGSTSTKDWLIWFLNNLKGLGGIFYQNNIHPALTNYEILSGFIKSWTSGESAYQMAELMHSYGVGTKPTPGKRSNQSALAKVIHIIHDGKRNIVHLANCYINLVEQLIAVKELEYSIPDELKMLPICLNVGVDNLNALKFRRRGFPRLLSRQLGVVYDGMYDVSALVNNWKMSGRIDGVQVRDELKKALFILN
jgi:replicative superfamily II helicase